MELTIQILALASAIIGLAAALVELLSRVRVRVQGEAVDGRNVYGPNPNGAA